MIEAFVEKIVASKDGFEWYLRFDGDPNDPLKCSFDGKRKEKATLSIEGKTFPSTHLSDAGSYQGQGLIGQHQQKPKPPPAGCPAGGGFLYFMRF
ncbi:MAG: hypothetical protein IKI63_03070 [Clostridia bacterium]|nr:hypothetical protein [Clostridia bacterium]